ncbi:MAG: SAF domain-containing protein [Actinomycetaceae bacterium]|nr:SAF domain-containing protein [Actinomycetaceae bacterium]
MKEKLGLVGSILFKRRKLILITLATLATFLTLAAIIQPFGSPAIIAVKPVNAGEIVEADAVELRERVNTLPPDAVTSADLIVGQRTLVGLEPGTIIRTAYVAAEPEPGSDRDTIALPVSAELAGIFAKGDTLDIYAPTTCDNDTPTCPATRLTQGAQITKIIQPDESQWTVTQSATLFLAIDPKDTNVVAGVTDSAAITLVKVGQYDASQGDATGQQ